MLKEETLIIKVKYDDDQNKKPHTWNWTELLNSDHEVEVLNYSSVEVSD